MAEARNSTINSTVLWIVAVIVLVLIFFGVHRLTRQELPLRVAQPEVQDLIKTTSTNGKVEPVDNFAAHAPIATMVTAVYAHAGERVPSGKLLLQLDDSDARAKLAAAVSTLRGAEADLQSVRGGGTQQEQLALSSNIAKAQIARDQAAANLDAVRKLEAQGAAAPSEVAQAELRLATANASLDSLERQKREPFASADLAHAKSAVAEAEASDAAAAQVVAQCNVHAPFAGTVYSLPVARYDYVAPGNELLSLANLSKLRVRAYFDEPEIGDLTIGDPVTITWDAQLGMKWHGHIVGLPSTIITYGTRNVGEVLVSIDDANNVLLPNTNVTVTVITQRVRDALTIPREALHAEHGRDYVYVVSGNTVRRAQVEVGALNLTEVQILSGLRSDAIVALGTADGSPITDGVAVRIVK